MYRRRRETQNYDIRVIAWFFLQYRLQFKIQFDWFIFKSQCAEFKCLIALKLIIKLIRACKHMYDYAVSPIRANNAATIVALRSAKYIYANATRWDRSIASQMVHWNYANKQLRYPVIVSRNVNLRALLCPSGISAWCARTYSRVTHNFINYECRFNNGESNSKDTYKYSDQPSQTSRKNPKWDAFYRFTT